MWPASEVGGGGRTEKIGKAPRSFADFGAGGRTRTGTLSPAVDFEFFGGRGPFRKLTEATTLYFPTKSANLWSSPLQKTRNY